MVGSLRGPHVLDAVQLVRHLENQKAGAYARQFVVYQGF